MIALAWQIVRARRIGLAGSFVALALGVALLTATALAVVSTLDADVDEPRWFTHADVVIAGDNTARLPAGQRGTVTVRTAESRAVPADLPVRLSAVDATVTVDYAAYAAVDGAPGDTLHPWSTATLHAYAWEVGGPPRDAEHLVLTAPTKHQPGDRVAVRTAAGPRRFIVSGVVRTAAPAAFYATDATAAGLAGDRIDAIALTAHRGTTTAKVAAQARAVVGDDPVRVLTGAQRRDAEPDPDADLLVGAVILLGNTAGLSAFISVFVVGSTFAYAVIARRRELALLRTAGATPGQVRRLVLGEALVVGMLAAGAGVALGSVVAPSFARWLADAGFAPSTFTARFVLWPAAAAFGIGLLIALLGAWLAARRASRVRPVEALRAAAVDRRPMTLSRWLIGLIAPAGAIPAILAGTFTGGAGAGYFMLAVLALISACAALAPALIPPLLSALTGPIAMSRGATGMMAHSNVLTAVRRTAATAAPILVTVGLAGAVLAGTATLSDTEQAAARSRITADTVVTGPIADQTVAAVSALPEVTAAAAVTDTTVYMGAANGPFDWTGRYVNGPDLSRVLRLPVVSGDLADLTGTDTIAVPAGTWQLGETATLALGDSTPVRLRVAAVFADQIDLHRTVLLPVDLRDAHTARPLADAVYLQTSSETAHDAVVAAAAAGGGTVIATPDYLSAVEDQGDRLSRLGMIAVVGLSLIYTAIAVANTMVMATGERTRDLATLRLSGATTRQVLRMIVTEAVLVSVVGIVLATVVATAAVTGLRYGLASQAPVVHVDVPWLPIGGIAMACLAIGVLASTLPAAVLLRHRPVDLARLRD